MQSVIQYVPKFGIEPTDLRFQELLECVKHTFVYLDFFLCGVDALLWLGMTFECEVDFYNITLQFPTHHTITRALFKIAYLHNYLISVVVSKARFWHDWLCICFPLKLQTYMQENVLLLKSDMMIMFSLTIWILMLTYNYDPLYLTFCGMPMRMYVASFWYKWNLESWFKSSQLLVVVL